VPEETVRRFNDPSDPIEPESIFTKSNFLVGYVDNGVPWDGILTVLRR
jgi:hypothetical protein